jgi:hypothetical protein
MKSKVFFSRNMRNDVKDALSNTLGINQTQDLGQYLGLGAPLLHHCISKQAYNYLLGKMWKNYLVGKVLLLCLLQEKLPLLSLPSLIFLRMSCKLLPFLHLRAKKHKFFADISFGDLLVIVGNSI